MSFYPPEINERFRSPRNAGAPSARTNAVGTGASFVCGAFVRFYLEIDRTTKKIGRARFASNGCGFALAAADVLAEKIVGRKLTELHGLPPGKIENEIEAALLPFGATRAHCAESCVAAAQRAFADFRARQLEEFAGEKALICTCFGVSEETIEKTVAARDAPTVEEIGEICRAGTGCGACRFLIREIIDAQTTEY